MHHIIIQILFFGLLMPTRTSCNRKQWLYTNNISDSINWERVFKKCHGLTFNSYYYGVDLFMDTMEIEKMTLPQFAKIKLMPNSKIKFKSHSKSIMNCVKVKMLTLKDWMDVNGWVNLDDPNNPAVPFTDRIPSFYDEVIFTSPSQIVMERSGLKFKDFILLNHKKSDLEQFKKHHNIRVDSKAKCTDPTGCANEINEMYSYMFCYYANEKKPYVDCENPIEPPGFCNQKRCGASIQIRTLIPGFSLDRIRRDLMQFKSFTHANKMSGYQEVVQIVFAERNFTGQSVIEATEYYYTLLTDDTYFAGDIELLVSGPPLLYSRGHIKKAILFVVEIFIGVLIMFGLLFLANSSTLQRFNITNRIMGNQSISTYVMRYDNIQGRGFIEESESVAGSVMNLNASFENPMFSEKPTMSSSTETLTSVLLEPGCNEEIEQVAEQIY